MHPVFIFFSSARLNWVSVCLLLFNDRTLCREEGGVEVVSLPLSRELGDGKESTGPELIGSLVSIVPFSHSGLELFNI